MSVDVLEGTANTVVDLARKVGFALTPAGATWPYGRDPQDRTLRLAPTFPPLQDVRDASEGIAICILLERSRNSARREGEGSGRVRLRPQVG